MRRQKLVFFLIIMLGATAPVAAVSGKLNLTLLPEVVVNEGRVRLAEVGTFAGSSELQAKVTGIDLGEAPPPGQFRLITRNYVEYKLAQAGVEKTDIQLQMPEQVRLVGAGTELTVERVVDFLRKDLAEEIPTAWTSWDLQLAGALGAYWLPQGEVILEREPMNEAIKPGTNLMKLRLVKEGQILRRFTLAVQITAKGRVPLLKSDLKRHKTLSAGVVSWEERGLKGGELAMLPQTPVRATRWLRQGEPIYEGDVQPVPHVAKGSRVVIECFMNGIHIKVPGEARRDGWKGQVIPVINIDSQKTVSALVVDTGKVEVR